MWLIRLIIAVAPSVLSNAKVQEFLHGLFKLGQAHNPADPQRGILLATQDPGFARGPFRDLLRRLFDRNPAPVPIDPSNPDSPVIPPPGPANGFSWGSVLMSVIAAVGVTFGTMNGCNKPPAPPPPAPGPVNPPAPPAPPMDAETRRIASALGEAYQKDAGDAQAKAEAKVWLKQVYAAAATYPKLRENPSDPESPYAIQGQADLVGRIRIAASSGLKPDDLKGTRSAIAKEVAAVIPFEGPLSAEQRAAAEQVFTRISTALGSF